MKQKYSSKLFLTIGLLIAASKLLVSQIQPELLMISDIVGPLIDSAERVTYYLFPEYPDEDFKAAQFFKLADGTIDLKVYLKNGTTENKTISKEKFNEYRTQINKKIVHYDEIDTSYVYSIRLIDETVLYGKFMEIKEREIIFETNYLGIYTIPKIKIIDIEKGMSINDSQSQRWFSNPHDTRHFFAPTARSLQKGEGYFQDVYLLLGFLNYGITDNILIGGGMSIIPFLDIDEKLFFLNPKVGFQVKDNLNLGGGIFYASFPGDDKRNRAVIGYGIGTYGSKENNVTLGLGYGTAGAEDIQTPLVMLGGMYRISRRAALVTENWFMVLDYKLEHDDDQEFRFWDYNEQEIRWDDSNYEPTYEQKTNEPTALISYGIRFFSEKLCVDLGFFNVLGDFEDIDIYIPGIPYLDFVVKF